MFRYSRTVQYYETHKMAIVHHSNYIRLFEEARCAYLSDVGVDFAYIESLGFMCPVVSVNCKYKKPLVFGDRLTVDVELKSFNGAKYEFEYKVYNQNSEICAEGESLHCFTDNSMKPVILRHANPMLYNKFIEAFGL